MNIWKWKYRSHKIRRRIVRILEIDQCQICWAPTRTEIKWMDMIVNRVIIQVDTRVCKECVAQIG